MWTPAWLARRDPFDGGAAVRRYADLLYRVRLDREADWQVVKLVDGGIGGCSCPSGQAGKLCQHAIAVGHVEHQRWLREGEWIARQREEREARKLDRLRCELADEEAA
jgi:hypothetical protein